MVVSNTSPLRYLIAVGQTDLVTQVFRDVLIPSAVLTELTHPSSREDVRNWMMQLPAWLQIRQLQAQPARELLDTLDRGESEAIQLALETRADFLLMDERLGRAVAASLGLTVIGALGLLRESYRQHFLMEPLAVLDEMRSIGFRLSQRLYREFQQEIETMRIQIGGS
jgi:predicted nucleic acid-binding protein